MTRDIAIFLGNQLGKFKEADLTENSVSWGSILKMTVDIDVTKPLKRALRMQASNGESYIVTFQYERLPNFCYLYERRYSTQRDNLVTLTNERPLFTTPTQSRSGYPSPLLRSTSELVGDSDINRDCSSPLVSHGQHFVLPQNLFYPGHSGVQLRIGSKRPSKVFGQESDDTFVHKITPPNTLPLNASVASLIDADNHSWNELLVRQLFWAPDVDVILSIPLARFAAEDSLVWHYTKDGLFSVKSVYHVARSFGNMGLSGTSHCSLNWKFIWGAAVPHKVWVFAWRVCHGILPTLSNLQRRKCNVYDVCPCCGMNTETDAHVLLECDIDRQIWSLYNLPWNIVAR
ncbi:hypothetical protein BUALT_Bualt16G0036100 [Buddleja alternifolia]|uniref:Reverse transcriptase zinc-binding domain-containing protein n=1 Tax=Buddleja alternifolia TaxID=168488 RepID=A0AAV6W9D6_9LAMI|nr:hypothetical protein BUALT_Bualt16G0036100 [Buddleja alternifolia]